MAFSIARFGARLMGKSPAFLESIAPAANLFRGIPTDDFVKQVYFKSHAQKPSGDVDPPRDGCGFIWIGPVVPFTGSDVERCLELARGLYAAHDFDVFVEILIESPRALILLFGVFYRRDDAGEASRASAWYTALRSAMIEAGYPPYRETAQSAPEVFDGNPAVAKLLSELKTALDPERTIAPGRYGIR
jgi:4-cresol dehydrogenase (hydroxylating)